MFQVVETGFPEFTTFSVGDGVDRRTVVCFQQQLLDYTLGNIRWEKARDTGEYLEDGVLVTTNNVIHQDKLDTNFLADETNASHDDDPGTANITNCDVLLNIPSSPQPAQPCQQFNSTDSSPTATPSKQVKSSSGGPSRRKKRPERAVYIPPMGRGKPLSANAVEFKPNSPGHVIAAREADDTSDDTCPVTRDVTDQVVTEITSALGGVQIESPSVDYASFQTSDSTINLDQYGHVIELYDFPPEMKTNDLMAAFNAFTSR